MRFQFHKGTIRTFCCKFTTSLSQAFQFHKGTIRTKFKCLIMYYLKLFQFHKGTIRTTNFRLRSPLTAISIP